jgi:hypothetical protein
VPLPVDVVVKHGHRAVAFVGHRDLAGNPERHGPVAVASPPEGAVTNGQGIEISIVSMSHAEEIAQGHVYAGCLFAVIVDSQTHQAGPRVLIIGHGDPDVAHHSRSLEIRHDQRLARHDALAIVIAPPETVVAGHAVGGEVFLCGADPGGLITLESVRLCVTCKDKHRQQRSDHV